MVEFFVVLFLILLWVYYINKCPDIKWCKSVKREYMKSKKKFGLPRFFSNDGGVVLWERFSKDVPFARVMLENKYEYPLTLTIKYHIDSFKLQDILEISDRLIYDRLKKELSVRSNSLEEGVHILIIANSFNKDLISRSQVESLTIQASNLTEKINKNNYATLKNIKDDYYISNH